MPAPRNRWNVSQAAIHQGADMESFLQRFASLVAGVLHGFDRMRFRGTKRQLSHVPGLTSWLWHVRVPLTEYKQFARDTTLSLCRGIEGPASEAKLYRFVNNLQESKEKIALQMAAERKQ